MVSSKVQLNCYIQCPSQLITDLDSGLIQVHNMTVSYKSSYEVERLAAKSHKVDCATSVNEVLSQT